MAPQPVFPIFLLALCILPFSLWLATVLSIYVTLRSYLIVHNWPLNPLAIRKRVLLTGEDDGAVLSTARVLRASGSSVYVVKQERIPFVNCLWTSKTIYKYIGLASGRLTQILRHLTKSTRFNLDIPANLPGSTLNLVESEKIDLWMHCDASRPSLPQLQARDIVLKHTPTKLFEPEFDTIRLARGYSPFAHHLRHHESEVQCPKTVAVRTRSEIHDILWKAPKGQRFLLERSAAPFISAVKANSGTKRDSGFDDSSTLVDASSDSDDFDGAETSTPYGEHIKLPHSTPNQTYSAVAAMQISPNSPWVMHEVISGRPGTISTLVVKGKIIAFAASTGSRDRTFSTAASSSAPPARRGSRITADHGIKEWQWYEETTFVDPHSTIGIALRRYAQRFVASLSEKPSTYLNLYFFLTDRSTGGGAEQKIVATGCDFNFSPVLTQQALAAGIGERLGRGITGGLDTEDELLLLPTSVKGGQVDVKSSLKLPRSTTAHGESLNVLADSLEELLNERDATFDHNDLVPWLWSWLVQAPIEVAFEGLVGFVESTQTRTVRY